MKLLSHSTPEKSVKMNIHSTEEKEKTPRKPRVSKAEREKEGRYLGFILLLLTIITAAVLQFFRK